jgi:hypothetical protein
VKERWSRWPGHPATGKHWLRQLPYLRAWATKYSGHGLVVLGVHTPEFGFESSVDNVSRASTAPAELKTWWPRDLHVLIADRAIGYNR